MVRRWISKSSGCARYGGPVSHSIFIGYRRDDTADAAGRIYDKLCSEFGSAAVFKDVDNIPVGVSFGDYIRTILPQCRVFLAMIGPSWLDVRDEAGRRRLDDPSDWVRIELEIALSTPTLQVVPILTNGARMPRSEDLPKSLRPLTSLNAALVRRDPDFHKDMQKLITALKVAARTGEVVISSRDPNTSAAVAWGMIEASLDIEDYITFQNHFPGTPEVILADRYRRQLEGWAQVPKHDPRAIRAFLLESRELFPALAAEVERSKQEAEVAWLNDDLNEDLSNAYSFDPDASSATARRPKIL